MPRLRIAHAFILLAIILSLSPAKGYDSYLDILRHTAMTLKGQAPYSDVAQDFYGFKALMTNQDPYALLGPALKTIGVYWKASFSSTHPPTAFLVVAPVAWLPWPISSMAWAWLMLIGLCLSLKIACGYSWDWALLLTVSALFWPPIATSFDQITILWLFGLAIAYHSRNKNPFLSGVFIAVASFTKLLPVVLLAPFILRRKWEGIKGFAFMWVAVIGILFLMSPKTLIRYFTSNRTNAIDIIMRHDNGSFLMFLYRNIGVAGLFITATALLLLLILAFRRFLQVSGGEISREEWNIYSFMAVMLMPIAWIFAIAPLVPNLFLLFQDKRLIVKLFTAGAIIPPLIMPPWGEASAFSTFGFYVLSGIALVLAQSAIAQPKQMNESVR